MKLSANKIGLVPIFVVVIIPLVFFWRFFLQGLLPIPSDALAGLYHPFRDYYAPDYPNGIPFKNFLITDPVRQQIPWRELGLSNVRDGFSGWNPYTFSGTPLAANYQSALFYPFNIVFLALPFHVGWSVLVVLQPLLAGLFMYLYLRKMFLSSWGCILGAMVYGFGGANMAWLTWNTMGHVVLWLPAILYLQETIVRSLLRKYASRKDLVIAGSLLTLSECMYLFAGHAQVAFYVFCTTTVYYVVRVFHIHKSRETKRPFLRNAASIFLLTKALAAFLVSVQLIPFIRFISFSARHTDQHYVQEGWFIPFRHLLQFIAPDFFGNPATLNYWGVWNYGEMVGYVGVIPLIMVFASLFVRRKLTLFLIGLAAAAFLFSLKNGISLAPFILKIPLLSTSQPTRLLFIVNFSFAALAAIGLDGVIQKKISFRKIVFVCAVTFLLYILGWLAVYYNWFGGTAENLTVSKRNLLLPTFIAFAGCMLLVASRKLLFRYRAIIVALLIGISMFDLFRFGWKFTPFTSKDYLFPITETTTFLKNQPGIFRVMSTDDRILPPNFSVMYRLQTIDGYDPLYLKNYSEFASALIRRKPDVSPFSFNRMVSLRDPNHPFIDMMNVKYILSLQEINVPHLVKVYEEGETKVYENVNAFPRAYLASRTVYSSNKNEVIRNMFAYQEDLRTTAFTTVPVDLQPHSLEPDENVSITRYTDTMVELSTKTQTARMVVLTDTYYPNWHVYVDGNKSKLYEVNYAFRGVVVPAGEHTVTFRYSLL